MGDKDKAADCPWCGPMRGHYGYTVGRFGTRLTCFCCDSHGPIAPTQDAALEAWNRRADLAAVQPAQVHPDPRDEVIARLVEALRLMRSTYPYNPPCYGWVEQVEAHKTAKAALAAVKGDKQ